MSFFLALFVLLGACKNPKFQEIVLQAATGARKIDLSSIRVIAVAPVTSAPMDIFLADQTRNYLAANSALKVLSKKRTEEIIFGDSFANTFSNMNFKSIEGSHKQALTFPDADAVILCQILGGQKEVLTKTTTGNGKSTSESTTSLSLRAEFKVLDAKGETMLKATGSATAGTQIPGVLLIGFYLITEQETLALILDHGAKTFIRDWVLAR